MNPSKRYEKHVSALVCVLCWIREQKARAGPRCTIAATTQRPLCELCETRDSTHLRTSSNVHQYMYTIPTKSSLLSVPGSLAICDGDRANPLERPRSISLGPFALLKTKNEEASHSTKYQHPKPWAARRYRAEQVSIVFADFGAKRKYIHALT